MYVHDYGALVEEHVEAGADVTIVTTEVEPGDAARYGVVEVDDGGRVRELRVQARRAEVEPRRPTRSSSSARAVLDLLEELAAEEGDDGLDDLGDELLPRLVDDGHAREHRFGGYWRDVGTIPAYWEAHQELLADDPPIDLDDPAWPVLTQATANRGSAHVLRRARGGRQPARPGRARRGPRGGVGDRARVARRGRGDGARLGRCCPARWCAPGRRSSERSSTTASRSGAMRGSGARTARSRSSGCARS